MCEHAGYPRMRRSAVQRGCGAARHAAAVQLPLLPGQPPDFQPRHLASGRRLPPGTRSPLRGARAWQASAGTATASGAGWL
jgi:hypothetical protein